MATPRDPLVTAEPGAGASLGWRAPLEGGGPAGIWTLDGAAIVASDADGPATVLVPGEDVRLLAVDLPVAGRAKRLAALPFAIEELIAEPIEGVHLALGAEIAPRRHLVGVVRHDRMAEWIARAEEAGLDHAALVPDALALPVPDAGGWTVDLGATRVVVRADDGTGFAIPAPLLRTAWEAAGRPRAIATGAPLPDDIAAGADALALDPLGRRLLAPMLDLRQGAYARRRPAGARWGRRLAQIAAIGVVAHAGIATADTIMLRAIADRRAEETRALVATMAPAAVLRQDDLAGSVADLLPAAGAGGGGANAFLPVATRVSAALAPIASTISVGAMRLDGTTVTIDVAPGDPELPGRIRAALAEAGVAATVAEGAQGIRIAAAAP